MSDGRLYRNDLRGGCSDLKFTGFAWNINPSGQVCDNEPVNMRVIGSGQVCSLGKFTQVSAAPRG